MSNTDIAAAALPQARPGHGRARVRTVADEVPPFVLVIAALGAMIWFLARDSFALSIIVVLLLYAGLGTSWNIIGGFGGQFSIAHSVFFAIGAYTAGNLYLHWQISPWIALIPAALLAAGVGVLISWPVFRLRGPFFAIATMALTEVAIAAAHYAEPVTGGASGLTIPYRSGWEWMIFRQRWASALLFLGYFGLTLAVAVCVFRSRLGYYLQAVRDNESAALASGIGVLRTKIIGMGISAALAGMGGVLFMMYVRIVDPHSLLSLFDVGVKIALIALIGGIGTIYGPLLGAMLVIPLDYWLRAHVGSEIPGGSQIVLGAILIFAALFLRRGIYGGLETLWTRLRRARG